MNFINQEIETYAANHSEPESEILKQLSRDTFAKVLMPRMLSGHIQGRLLSMFSKMVRPKRILEVGTFTGYSAICLSEGLDENGLLYTIDINEELETMVRSYFTKAGVNSKINYLIGNALEIIPTLKETFDMVFIDADKENYAAYYDGVFDKISKGGYIIADNVLWSGKVLESYTQKKDADTQAIIDFNTKLSKDVRVETLLLPIRDGLLIARKK